MRHGRTAWNAERRFQGQTDVPLDDEGRAQAMALGVHLRGERFDLAVTSDLARAVATAEAICAGRDVVLEREPGLREMRFGVWEGRTWDEIVADSPELDERYETSPQHYTPDGGESWDALCERVGATFRRIVERVPAGGRALVVSHAGVMHAILHTVMHVPEGAPKDPSLGVRLGQASIMRLASTAPGGWTLTRINETAGVPDTTVTPAR